MTQNKTCIRLNWMLFSSNWGKWVQAEEGATWELWLHNGNQKRSSKTSTVSSSSCTLIDTGYIVPPISKLPFLNIMTEVLLMQVPVPHGHKGRGHRGHQTIEIIHTSSSSTLTFGKYQDGKFGLGCDVSSQPTHTHTHVRARARPDSKLVM